MIKGLTVWLPYDQAWYKDIKDNEQINQAQYHIE
jgi:hypothetical protein